MKVKHLTTIEELAKSHDLHQGDIEAFAKETLYQSTKVLDCERSNIWLFNGDKSTLNCLAVYTKSKDQYSKESSLSADDLPNYFSSLSRNEMIVSKDAKTEEMNQELRESYLVPNKIGGMIDIPIRSEGKMIGLICFEHVGKTHEWSNEEKKFCQSVAQLLSLVIETNQKQEYREKLENIIHQKELLIQEINHRVKNNLAVIMSLLNLQKHNTRDGYHSRLFEEVKDKVYSMSLIQEQLHTSDNIDSIDLDNFLRNLVQNLNHSYGRDKNIDIQLDLNSVPVDVSKAIPCGLISNEVLTNSFKYAFENNPNPVLSIRLKKENGRCHLEFSDNGPGFDKETNITGMGMELMCDLSSQIDGKISLNSEKGVQVVLEFVC